MTFYCSTTVFMCLSCNSSFSFFPVYVSFCAFRVRRFILFRGDFFFCFTFYFITDRAITDGSTFLDREGLVRFLDPTAKRCGRPVCMYVHSQNTRQRCGLFDNRPRGKFHEEKRVVIVFYLRNNYYYYIIIYQSNIKIYL